MSDEKKPNVRHPICSVRTLVTFFAILLIATLLFAIIYFAVSYTNIANNAFGTLTCTITREDSGFHEDRHYMLCQIENQIVDAPKISIASTGDDRSVNDFSIWNQTNMFYLPDRIGERFPNLFTVGSGYTKLRSLQRSSFVGFTRLRNVFVTNSDLEEIEHGAFDPLDSLVVLDLSSNKIKNIDPSWFENKKLLAWLSFNSNEIESIPTGCFDNLPSLGTVLLNSNKITSITSPLFVNNGNFGRLTVSLYSSTCLPSHIQVLTIPPDTWKSIVREFCNGTNVLNVE